MKAHPLEELLRPGVLPHIWCPGCGLGVVLRAFVLGFDKAKIPPQQRVVVSGIGCSARSAGYLKMDSYHTTHGRALPFATGIKLARPDLTVTVFSGDGDLFSIGGNHFIHAARRNMDLHVVCVNNFTYGMTGGQAGPTTPPRAKSSTTPDGNAEDAFCLPALAAACGAVYVARWTTLDTRRLAESIGESFTKKGFTFIEVVSPCPVSFGRANQIGGGAEEMAYYRKLEQLVPRNALLRGEITAEELAIGLHEPVKVGVLVDRERPTFLDRYHSVKKS